MSEMEKRNTLVRITSAYILEKYISELEIKTEKKKFQ